MGIPKQAPKYLTQVPCICDPEHCRLTFHYKEAKDEIHVYGSCKHHGYTVLFNRNGRQGVVDLLKRSGADVPDDFTS